MAAWADKWIEIGLTTGPADREKFAAAAEKCYKFAGLPWHGNIVWVSSPIVGALSAPIANLILNGKHGHDAVNDAVNDAVGDAVRDAVGGAMGAVKKDWNKYLGGQFWVSGWWYGSAYTSFFREICNLELNGDLWERALSYEEINKSVCWWFPYKNFIIAVEHPEAINRELVNPNITRGWNSHRLHCDHGPAIYWPDGWSIYSIHGVRVTEQIVMRPETLTVEQIDAETNAEVRRIMVERFGMERYVRESGSIPIHELPKDYPIIGLRGAKLWRKDSENDEPIVCIDMDNSSQEPDGSIKRYMLRVDPNAYRGRASKDCLAAMASTYRFEDGSMIFAAPEDYAPEIET